MIVGMSKSEIKYEQNKRTENKKRRGGLNECALA